MEAEEPQPLYASVAYRKVPGTLALGRDGVLVWHPASAGSSATGFRVQDVHLKGLKVSKPGAAQTALRLEAEHPHTINGEPAALLVFSAETEKALADRERFKEQLAAAIARARAQSLSGEGTPQHSTARDTPDVGTARAPRGASQPAAVSEVKLRSQVLLAHPSLLALHKDVVGSESISDAGFWAHPARAALLKSERARLEQRTGRRAHLADPNPTQNEAGELKINITPQLIRELFEQYPVLVRAYDDLVPKKLDEGTFWTRYFHSKLYHRLRASVRSQQSVHTIPPDPLFDAYLEAEDDAPEPRRAFNPHDALLDLESTAEDHGETGNVQDYTMRPGFDRRALPLVRRFNEHAESLLRSSLGDSDGDAGRARRKTGGVGEEYGASAPSAPAAPRHIHAYDDRIVLDDLNVHAPQQGRRLEIHDPKVYFEAGAEQDAARGSPRDRDYESADMRAMLAEWTVDLSGFHPSSAAMRATLNAILQNMHQQANRVRAQELTDLPETVYKQLISCHAATIEFLQQFWQAATPASEVREDATGHIVRVPPAQRVETARSMLRVLSRAGMRMDRVAQLAEEALPDYGGAVVRDALFGVREAVQRALEYGGVVGGE
ncbi:RNA polymerase II transcription factor B subunit 1 [Malassezia sp. CBS 17886]|nr:RNA polymerase II transcription factor B subunit 1 [Malassezia sp. CBS 17886]